VPILSLLVGPKVAVVAATALAPLLTLSVAASSHRHVRWRTVVVVSGSAVAGMPIGLWVLTHVSGRTLEVVIGVAVLAFTGALALGVAAPDRVEVDVASGFTSGILATSTGTNGPPIVLAMQARGVPRHELRATLSAIFLVQGTLALGAFVAAGQFTAEVARVVAAGIPGLILGRLLGDVVFGRLDHERHRGLVLVLLVVAGVSALLEALLGRG
jgi:uncharacterized membrane protein YfcA